MLNLTAKYYRKNNIVFEAASNLPIVSFTQKFPDLIDLSQSCISYLNRYIEMFPNLCNIEKSKIEITIKEEKQLSLF